MKILLVCAPCSNETRCGPQAPPEQRLELFALSVSCPHLSPWLMAVAQQILAELTGDDATCSWSSGTSFVAHPHILDVWGTLESSDYSQAYSPHTKLTRKAACAVLSRGATPRGENTICRVAVSNGRVTKRVHILRARERGSQGVTGLTLSNSQ